MAGKNKRRPIDPSIPSFMLNDLGHGIGHIPVEEIGWNEEQHESDIDKHTVSELPSTASHEIRPLIESILLAIILENFSIHEALGRLGKAKEALGIDNGRRGRPETVDDACLREIATRYHCAYFTELARKPNLDTIIRKVIQSSDNFADWKPCHDASLARLRKKFNKKNIVCCRR